MMECVPDDLGGFCGESEAAIQRRSPPGPEFHHS